VLTWHGAWIAAAAACPSIFARSRSDEAIPIPPYCFLWDAGCVEQSGRDERAID
jgi:hypothetical protein